MYDVDVIRRTARDLFDKLLNESTSEARRVGVRVSSLGKAEKAQKRITDFFSTSL
jgi:hypothetical protein